MKRKKNPKISSTGNRTTINCDGQVRGSSALYGTPFSFNIFTNSFLSSAIWAVNFLLVFRRSEIAEGIPSSDLSSPSTRFVPTIVTS